MKEESFMDIEQEGIILDACCIINLYASSIWDEVLKIIPSTFYVAKYIKDKEALKIKGSLTTGPKYIDIDLDTSIQKGSLQEIAIETQNEINTFVNLAANLDDGEARCGSLAIHRKLLVATDEKAACKLFLNHNPVIPTIPTLALIKSWAEIKSANSETISSVLKNIEQKASYRPNTNHEFYDWWQKHR